MEMPTLAANIFFDDERVSKEDKDSQKMNWEFREFFRDVETQWKAVDPRAKPHYAKVFGFDRAHETGKLTVFGGATIMWIRAPLTFISDGYAKSLPAMVAATLCAPCAARAMR